MGDPAPPGRRVHRRRVPRQPGRGLPARRPRPTTTRWMQAVAAEMNLSETAFVMPPGPTAISTSGGSHRPSRSTSAATRRSRRRTRSGRRGGSAPTTPRGSTPAAGCSSPTRPTARSSSTSRPARCARRWSPGSRRSARRPRRLGTFDNGHQLVVELADEAAVLATAPDFAALGRAADRVWVVTAPARRRDRRRLRVPLLRPRYGIDEDPVTGSAHCALAPVLGRPARTRRARRPPGLGPRRPRAPSSCRGDRVDPRRRRRHRPPRRPPDVRQAEERRRRTRLDGTSSGERSSRRTDPTIRTRRRRGSRRGRGARAASR